MTKDFGADLLSIKSDPITIAKLFRARAKKDKDAVIALTGYEGEGKSTLAVIMSKESDNNFDISKQMIWSANEEKVRSLIKDLPKYSAIVADEAIKLLHKQNWQTKLQKLLNMLFTVSRDENKIVYLLMPRFVDFNEYFRNHRIYLWIHVVERGYAVIFQKTWNQFSSDPWNMAYNDKLISSLPKKRSGMNIQEKLRILAKCKGFLCWFEFSDLDKETKKVYKKLKNKNKYVQEQEEETLKENKDKINSSIRIARLINSLSKERGEKPSAICSDVAGISYETYRKYEKIREEHDKKEAFLKDQENERFFKDLKSKNILIDDEDDDSEEESDDLEYS